MYCYGFSAGVVYTYTIIDNFQRARAKFKVQSSQRYYVDLFLFVVSHFIMF